MPAARTAAPVTNVRRLAVIWFANMACLSFVLGGLPSAAPWNPDEFGNIGVAMMGTCLVVSLIFVASRRLRLGLRGLTRLQVAAAATLYGGAQVAMWALGMAGASVAAASWLIGVAMGACTVPLLTAWMACYDLDFRSIMFYGSFSAVASVALSFVMGLLAPTVAALVWCLCALVGVFAPVFIGGAAGKKRKRGRSACGIRRWRESCFGDGPLRRF